jgi:hypothetical protein
VSGNYIFELENDDGGIVLINNDAVIKDKLKPGQIPTDFLKPLKEELFKSIEDGKYDDFIRPNAALMKPAHVTNRSDPVALQAGQFVPIEVR